MARPASAAVSVFYDKRGYRWRGILAATAAFCVSIAGLALWIAPQIFAPEWQVPGIRAANYPQQLQSEGVFDHIPVVGDEGADTLARVDLVKHEAGKTYLADPFSGRIFRRAAPGEVQTIGERKYALEWYGHLPSHQLALTFDDGPDPRNTPEILDILSRYHVRATFFVIGENVMRNPGLLNREIREGHAVGNHTLSHIGFSHGSFRDRMQLVEADRVIRTVGHYQTRMFRIPYSDPDHNALAIFEAQQLGYVTVDLSLDTNDWRYKPGQTVPLPHLDGRGHVVLMHDGGSNRAATVRLLPRLIKEARAKGYVFTSPDSILPPRYHPVRNIAPSLGDRAALWYLWSSRVLPARLINWLFWFGVSTLTLMSMLYLTLALANHRKQRRRVWPDAGGNLPLVSVIIPAYNEAKVVAKTLRSLTQSEYLNLEVIAVDDGSADDTWQVLAAFADEWPSLHIFHQANQGKSAALDLGIAYASGEIIVTVDADTVLEPQTIRTLARHFNDPGVAAVAGHVKIGNRRNILTAWQSLEFLSGICVTRMAEAFVGAVSIAPGACSAWRKAVVLEAGGFPHVTLAEDCDLTLSIQALGYKVVQENAAVAWTEAPMTVRSLAKQRLRWTFGNLQAYWKHRNMVLRPRYGILGMVTLPYAILSLLVPLLFLPLTYIAAAINLADGNWMPVALFGAFVAGVHFIISAVALAIARERPWHLLVVPIYRVIYEPLRAYLLYASALQIARGRATKWYRPERTESVRILMAGTAAACPRIRTA